MICYCGRGLFTLHVESAAWETNPDETLKKIHSMLRKGGGRNRQLALLQFSFHAGENLWKGRGKKRYKFRGIHVGFNRPAYS